MTVKFILIAKYWLVPRSDLSEIEISRISFHNGNNFAIFMGDLSVHESVTISIYLIKKH